MEKTVEKWKLKFNKPIMRWDEAIPLGNGLSGALIWGPSNGLRFSLDRGDLWDTTPYEGIYKKEFTYDHMVKLVKEGNNEEIRRIFETPYDQTLPSKLPAGKIIFDFGSERKVSSELDLKKAEAEIRIGEDVLIKSFLHAKQKVGLIRINKKLSEFSFHVENPQYGIPEEEIPKEQFVDSLNTGSLKLLVYPKAEFYEDSNCRYFVQKITETFSYGIFVKLQERNEETELAFFVGASNDGKEWKDNALHMLEVALEQGYEKMRISHEEWWKDYWGKSSVSLPDDLFERNWYLTQYFLGSCSRKGFFPMPLQGVWTADDGMLPPWKGDYHLDLNVQMSYYSYLKANHLEEGEALLDFLWEMVDCGREFAKTFYHSEGICLPPCMSLDGVPLGGWAMYAYSPTNQIWVSQAFERHYRATGDRKFLRERAYPYLKETGLFIMGLLKEKDGKYYLPISSSPEIHDNQLEAYVTPNSNYDLALMRWLFKTLVVLSRKLENGEEEKWEKVEKKLPELEVNENGVLKVSPDEELNESHRHFSHAMSIHPLRLLDYEGEENQRIIDATIFDLERLGTGYWVGFSYAWMAELYAVQRNGNGAFYQLRVFWEQYCSSNGFHLNGDYQKRGTSTFHYRPFTLEGNFGAADALQEMLLQSEENKLYLFPAVPEEWMEKTVAFENFRAENGLLVSAVLKNGKVVLLELKPEKSTRILLKKTQEMKELVKILEGKETVNGEYLEMELEKVKRYEVSF